MTVNVVVNGVDEGKIYLQKVNDKTLIKVDSSQLSNGKFFLEDEIEQPEIYFLSLSGTDKILQFFADKGNIDIETSLKSFGEKPKITGSKNQELFLNYTNKIKHYNDLKLELSAKKNFYKGKKQLEHMLNLVDKKAIKYTYDFVLNNKDFEVSPYVTLTTLYKLNTKALDSVLQSLPENILNSKYGKKLSSYVAEVKKEKK